MPPPPADPTVTVRRDAAAPSSESRRGSALAVRRSSTAGGMIVAGAVLLLVALASRDLRLPGLYYDELIQIVPALELARGPLASPVGVGPRGGQISIFGHVVPFMTMDYMGAVKQFTFLPVAWLVGTTPESIRFFSIGMAVLAMLATYAFARRILGPVIVAIVVLLLATDPTMLFVAPAAYVYRTLQIT